MTTETLTEFGYVNKVCRLNAKNFSVPQKRECAYMISTLCQRKSDKERVVNAHFTDNSFEYFEVSSRYSSRKFNVGEVHSNEVIGKMLSTTTQMIHIQDDVFLNKTSCFVMEKMSEIAILIP